MQGEEPKLLIIAKPSRQAPGKLLTPFCPRKLEQPRALQAPAAPSGTGSFCRHEAQPGLLLRAPHLLCFSHHMQLFYLCSFLLLNTGWETSYFQMHLLLFI